MSRVQKRILVNRRNVFTDHIHVTRRPSLHQVSYVFFEVGIRQRRNV
ncbi:hypothetical protein SUDANB9_06091 [Streptomyces sp. enrichment culture]